jgi:hypothetical protein
VQSLNSVRIFARILRDDHVRRPYNPGRTLVLASWRRDVHSSSINEVTMITSCLFLKKTPGFHGGADEPHAP